MPKSLISKAHFLFVMLLLVCTAHAKNFGRVADQDGYTNMRSMPTKKGDVVAWVMNGSCVELIGSENGWYKVKTNPNEEVGFIFRKNLKVVESCSKSTEYMVPAKCDVALDVLFRLENVGELATWKLDYSSCIDKEMKSAVGEFLSRKFSRDWSRQLEFVAKEEYNSDFVSLVSSSLATNSDSTSLSIIQSSAKDKCPTKNKYICETISKAASEGLKRR